MEGHCLGRIGDIEFPPHHLLGEIFTVEKPLFKIMHTFRKQGIIARSVVTKSFPDFRECIKRFGIDTRTHSVRSPKFDVVGIMMRFFERPGLAGVPSTDTVFEALHEERIQFGDPFLVATDPPVTIGLQNSAELSVGCGVKVMSGGTYGKVVPEDLMPFAVLSHSEFRFTQCALHCRKKMRQRLGIIPYMGA